MTPATAPVKPRTPEWADDNYEGDQTLDAPPPRTPPPTEPPPADAYKDSVSVSRPIGAKTETESRPPQFREPVLWSQLTGAAAADWLWQGYIAKTQFTLLSALWKAGKTTLLSLLVKAMDRGGLFAGRIVKPSHVLYVSEETETQWRIRREKHGGTDNVHFDCRPFKGRPNFLDWHAYIKHLVRCVQQYNCHLVVFDTLSNLWPVIHEKDAGEVTAALMELYALSQHAAVLAVHHLRKGDGDEATASRGSGALPSFMDTIVEMRRQNPKDANDRGRVLRAYGRNEETPAELVMELNQDGDDYTCHGDAATVHAASLRDALDDMLPTGPPGYCWDDIKAGWPNDTMPAKQKISQALQAGVAAGRYQRTGAGVKNEPYCYHNSIRTPFDED